MKTVAQLVILAALAAILACAANREAKMDGFTSCHAVIRYTGDQTLRSSALEKLARAFTEAGISLADYTDKDEIHIAERGDYYAVEVSKYSMKYGISTVWSFEIVKASDKGFYIDIQFDGDSKSKKDVIALLDRALRADGNLGAYGDLSGGIEDLRTYMQIRISDRIDRYGVDMSPKSGAGHDFCFSIDRKTGKISDVVVGEVMPSPEP